MHACIHLQEKRHYHYYFLFVYIFQQRGKWDGSVVGAHCFIKTRENPRKIQTTTLSFLFPLVKHYVFANLFIVIILENKGKVSPKKTKQRESKIIRKKEGDSAQSTTCIQKNTQGCLTKRTSLLFQAHLITTLGKRQEKKTR